jgi:hypothetical protein
MCASLSTTRAFLPLLLLTTKKQRKRDDSVVAVLLLLLLLLLLVAICLLSLDTKWLFRLPLIGCVCTLHSTSCLMTSMKRVQQCALLFLTTETEMREDIIIHRHHPG